MRKPTQCLMLFAFLLPFTAAAQTDGDRLFDPSYVHEIRFESPTEGFFELLVSAWLNSSGDNIPYQPGNVRIDGQLIDSAGVRLKGGISIFDLKKPLKIDFNRYVSGQNYDGIKKLNLQNADYDAAVQRDLLGYYIFRQGGVKASRAAYANVYFNNTYHGVYILVEQVDKTFLDNHFASDAGTLYKDKTCTVEVESGDSTLAYYQNMMTVVNTLSGAAFVQALDQILDTEACLRFFLIENFIEAKDNPIDVNCNFYLYRQPESGLLYWIPWDLNYAFFGGLNYPLMHVTAGNKLYKKMLETPEYRQRYLELACEMLDYVFIDTALQDFIDQNAQLIRADVAVDPRYPFMFERFDQEIAAIKALMVTRRQDFLDGLAAEAFTCPALESPVPALGISINELVASNDSTSGIADPSGDFPDWIELYNNTAQTVSLEGFYLSHDADFKKHWAFPSGASIAPGSYLIVWADRDISEPGLHAGFKLDKDGGQLFLIFEDFTIVDSVSYGPQTTNIALARVPNGTGAFTKQSATFSENNGVSGMAQPESFPVLQIHPNPGVDQFRVSLPRLRPEAPVVIRLINLLGQVVVQREGMASGSDVPVRHLPGGLYFMVVQFGDRYLTQQVVVGKN